MSLKQRSRLVADLRVVFQDPYSSLNPARTIGQTLVEPLRLMGIKGAEALAQGPRRRWSRSACPARPSTATRRSSPAASGSASPSPGRWSATRRSSSSTSRCQRAGPVDPGAGAQPARRPARPARPGVPVHRPRPRRRPVPGPARRRALPRPDHGDRPGRGGHPAAPAPVHGGADRGGAGAAAGRAGRPPRGPRGARASAPPAPRSPSPTGCPFVPRCPLATDICGAERPPLRLVDGNLTACHHAEKVPAL